MRDSCLGAPNTSIRHILGLRECLVAFCALLTLACSTDGIVSVSPNSASRTIAAAVGQELRISLGNVGPAEYESPPQISSPVLMFLGVDVIPPFNPGGPTQQFRFEAMGTGQAIVHFRRLLEDSVVSTVDDTVQIR